MLEVGAPAPAFTLADQDGRPVGLADLAGKWVVLYFYPEDDTPGCTIEACEFTASIKDFEGLDAVVYGCSPDSPASHRAFIEKHQLKIDLLADEDHAMMELYEAWGEKVLYGRKMIGVTRSTVIIDPDGNVAHRWKRANAKGHAANVHKRLTKLQG
ncbi:MAG: redoxin domain-containing protein [Acidobacteria bacterium]|nr:redoxin domain-containing protein [Acidobacteriota bacterium]